MVMSDATDPAVAEIQRDLKAARTQADVLSRELVLVQGEHSIVVRALIKCQGLIAQFLIPEVRRDFLAGKIVIVKDPEQVLNCLEAFREILLPSSGELFSDQDEENSEKFVARLLSRSEREPLSKGGEQLKIRQSFALWRDFVSTMMLSSYWLAFANRAGILQASDGMSEVSELRVGTHEPNADPRASGTDHLQAQSPEHEAEDEESSSASIHPEPAKSKKKRKKKQRHKKTNSSTDDTDSSTTEATTEDDSGGANTRNRKPRVRNAVKREPVNFGNQSGAPVTFTFPKEVVPPPIFKGTSGDSLKRFLKSYERYFAAKFNGTEREMSVQLGKFIQGPARSAYDAVNGTQLRYSKLATKLQGWYSAERTSQRSNKLGEFQRATMNESDTYNLFCLKLEQLAKNAFPDSPRDRERQLCQKFRESVPAGFVEKLDATRVALSALGQKLTWDSIKKVSETNERQNREREASQLGQPSLWYSRAPPQSSSPLPITMGSPTQREDRKDRTRVFGRSPPTRNEAWANRRGDDRANGRRYLWCNYCGRAGHEEDNCWLKQDACGVCGGREHRGEDCPHQRRSRAEIPRERLRCSRCEGNHLGKDCLAQDGAAPKQPLNS